MPRSSFMFTYWTLNCKQVSVKQKITYIYMLDKIDNEQTNPITLLWIILTPLLGDVFELSVAAKDLMTSDN